MEYKNLLLERNDGVAVVTLNRPEKLNALSRDLQLEMLAVCDELRADDDVRAVVWTGAGRGFCSGADLTGGGGNRPEPRRNDMLDEYSWVGRQAKAVYGLDKPTIAAVNGVAAGAGMSLALACDVRVGSSRSRFKTVFIERNLSPDAGMTYFLPRIVGVSRAFDLVMTSRAVEGEEAFRLGLLDRYVEDDRLLEEATALARMFAEGPPIAIAAAKRGLQHSLDSTFDEQLKYEIVAISHARRATHDAQESALSFREKRKARFLGQ
jgi:2-(1,2-epoxy-1,2-dihydrophenyl)acetyl-CoA isomerase